MILLVDQSRIDDLKALTYKSDIYACRVECLLESYGLKYTFAQFHIQYDESGKPVSAIAKYYSDMTVYLTANSNIPELAEFIECIGFGSISSSKPIIPGIYREDEVIMKLDRSLLTRPCLPEGAQIITEPELNEVYKLLSSCRESSFEVPQYEDFIIDMSHKLRHSTALCTAVSYNGELAAFSMTVAQSIKCAVIGATAVKKQYRRRGLGSLCVKELCFRLPDRDIFIVRQREKNLEFYTNAGFC